MLRTSLDRMDSPIGISLDRLDSSFFFTDTHSTRDTTGEVSRPSSRVSILNTHSLIAVSLISSQEDAAVKSNQADTQ